LSGAKWLFAPARAERSQTRRVKTQQIGSQHRVRRERAQREWIDIDGKKNAISAAAVSGPSEP
jgi:hypothetical protein